MPQILQFPAAAIMWHRRDVQEAPLVAGSLYTPRTVFEWSEDRKPLPPWRLKSPGKAPALLEAITGTLRIQNVHASSLKAWTLDVTGKRRSQAPVTAGPGSLVLEMRPEYETVYYELATE